MNNCPKSEYKDNRHHWDSGSGYGWKEFVVRRCSRCRCAEVIRNEVNGMFTTGKILAVQRLGPEFE